MHYPKYWVCTAFHALLAHFSFKSLAISRRKLALTKEGRGVVLVGLFTKPLS